MNRPTATGLEDVLAYPASEADLYMDSLEAENAQLREVLNEVTNELADMYANYRPVVRQRDKNAQNALLQRARSLTKQ